MSDLCWTCQQNGTLLLNAANMSLRHKSQVSSCQNSLCYILVMHTQYIYSTVNLPRHLRQLKTTSVTTEWSYYKNKCEKSKENVLKLYSPDGEFNPPLPGMRIPPLSNDTVVHYSFDIAQQVCVCVCVLCVCVSK